MKPARLLAAISVAALFVSACGGSSSQSSQSTDSIATEPGSAAVTETIAAPAAGDCQLADPLRIAFAADFNLGGISGLSFGEGDRVELYRELKADPKDMRRRRARLKPSTRSRSGP